MTLPKEVRAQLRLEPGDRLDVTVENRRIILTPKTLALDELCAILPAATRTRSLGEMDQAIKRRARQGA